MAGCRHRWIQRWFGLSLVRTITITIVLRMPPNESWRVFSKLCAKFVNENQVPTLLCRDCSHGVMGWGNWSLPRIGWDCKRQANRRLKSICEEIGNNKLHYSEVPPELYFTNATCLKSDIAERWSSSEYSGLSHGWRSYRRRSFESSNPDKAITKEYLNVNDRLHCCSLLSSRVGNWLESR